MKRVLYFLMILLVFANNMQLQAKDKNEFRYEIVPVGVGSQGTTLIKVYSYAKNQQKAIELAKKNAVHGVLFKGVVGGNGVSPQAAIVKYADYEKNREFFYDFFNQGVYLQFVHLSSDGITAAEDMVKVGNLYKIGVVVSVDKAALRKYLEENGIVKKLGSTFK